MVTSKIAHLQSKPISKASLFHLDTEGAEKLKSKSPIDVKKEIQKDGCDHVAAQTFTFRELAAATKNFSADCLMGGGGFGRVYKGRLESTNQVSLNLFNFLEFSI
ncbi:hypothetical protein MRB53_028731 [Persea americana]|uniref:Uncharacterized protein n=1 Tax=Persea americana TaxID=3435 RepID=A0ACC2KGB9_PERAE|nr:hypothetical protein MRB53_028731 [Persea americana]